MEQFEARSLQELNPRGCALVVSLTGDTPNQIAANAAAVRGTADAVEIRADLLQNPRQHLENPSWIDHIREAAAAPIIATLRTRDHGGNIELPFMDYAEALAEMARYAEWVDIQYDHEMPPPILMGLLEAVAAGGAKRIVSKHHHDNMPSVVEIDSYLADVEALGVEVAKIAVNPQNLPQVAQLMQVISRHAEHPTETVGIAMGKVGTPSRITGHLFGNAATYAYTAAGDNPVPVAPGQIEANRLASALDAIAAAAR